MSTGRIAGSAKHPLYIVVYSNNLTDLAERVEREIDGGYLPSGGLCVTAESNTLITTRMYYQAMMWGML